MIDNVWLERTQLMLGEEQLKRLRDKHVLIVGLGGVGAYAAEMICRAGINKLTIADNDIVQASNINRQLIALHSTIGHSKADLMLARLKDINPNADITVFTDYVKDKAIYALLDANYDYVIDAIDTLSPKVYLIVHATNKGFPMVSAMGAGGKLDPTKIKVADLSQTFNCRFAYDIRKRLRRLGITTGIKAVFSDELVESSVIQAVDDRNKKSTVGTISYMPAVFGCVCASVAIRDLLSQSNSANT